MKIEIAVQKHDGTLKASYDCAIIDEYGGGTVEGGGIEEVRELIALVVEENLIRLAE